MENNTKDDNYSNICGLDGKIPITSHELSPHNPYHTPTLIVRFVRNKSHASNMRESKHMFFILRDTRVKLMGTNEKYKQYTNKCSYI